MFSSDCDVEVDEPLNAKVTSIEVKVLNEGCESPLHVFFNVHLLFVDRLDLHEFVFVVEIQEERVLYKIEIKV